MAWDDEMIPILRNLINDTSDTPAYSDDRLATAILVSVPMLQIEVRFQALYAASVADETLKPDPTAASPRDDAFITLCSLKAALGIMAGEIKQLVNQGIEIRDGDSMIRLGRDPRGLQAAMANYQKLYDDAMYAYKTGGNDGLGQVITSPFKFLPDWEWGMGNMYHGFGTGRYNRGYGSPGGW